MALTCSFPDPDLGVALRLSTYLDCQARALGENGFQALAGGPVLAGLLSGLVTIYVALIGYRLILGQMPNVRGGVGWAVRLGLVLALVTSWPAFQTLVYRVAVDGPDELAAVLLPAAGLTVGGSSVRVQAAYDAIRLGPPEPDRVSTQQGQAPGAGNPQEPQRFGPAPQTASAFVITTTGISSAFRLSVGFLLAIGPIAILGLLFDTTVGLLTGWIRALVGATLGVLAATIATSLELVIIESELAELRAYSTGEIGRTVDSQGLTTIVLLFGVVVLVLSIAAMRAAGAIRLPALSGTHMIDVSAPSAGRLSRSGSAPLLAPSAPGAAAGQVSAFARPRAAAVADALASAAQREQTIAAGGSSPQSPTRSTSTVEAADRSWTGTSPLGVTGRRSAIRRTRLAQRRDWAK